MVENSWVRGLSFYSGRSCLRFVAIATGLAMLTQVPGCPEMLYEMFTWEDWEEYMEDQDQGYYTIGTPDPDPVEPPP